MTEDVRLRRERALSDIVGDSFTLLFAHLGPLAAIVFPAAITALAFSLLFVAVGDEAIAIALFPISLVVQFLVFEFVRSAGVVYLDRMDRRDVIPSAESLDQAQQRVGIIAGAAIRSSLIVLLLSITVIGIPWAIMRLVRWAFLSQVIMLEDKRGEEVLATSAELVSGYWWSTAARLLVTGLVIGIPTLIMSGIANAALPTILAAFFDAGLVFITVPYGIISTTLMYFDLKSRKARHDNVSLDRQPAP